MVELETPPPVVIPPVVPPKVEEIKAEQILTYMGFEDVKDFPAFQDKLRQEYIRKNLEVVRADSDFYSQLLGGKIGGIKTALQRGLRAKGVEFTDEDFKEPKIENLVEGWAVRLADRNADKVKELETKLSTGVDERITKLQTDFDALNTKYQEATGKLATTETEWSAKLQEKDKEFKNFNLKAEKAKAQSSIQYANGTNDLTKRGFIAGADENVTFDFDTDGKFMPFKDGKKISNPAKADTFLDANEYYKAEAIKAGVWAVSPHGGKPAEPKKTIVAATPEVVKPHNQINPLRPKIRTGV